MVVRLSERVEYLRPYIVAEVGVNHEGDIVRAERLIDLAADAGADAVKFQTYSADLLALKQSPAYWDTSKESARSQHELFSRYDSFGDDEYRHLWSYCKSRAVDFLSTPFDLGAVDLLKDMVPYFKVASADVTNIPLLRAVAKSGKPVILSTGASSFCEVADAVATLRLGGCEVALLHCVLNYPTDPARANLARMRDLTDLFPECLVGYSCHVSPDDGLTSLQVAAASGALVIEKHFTDDRSLPGNDHYHAMDARLLTAFGGWLATARHMWGSGEPIADESEAILHARRSIVVAIGVEENQILREEDLICKRPGDGIGAEHWDAVVGRRVASDLPGDHQLTWRDLV